MAYNVSPTIFYTILFLTISSFIMTVSTAHRVPALYIFGDSLLDVGNNNYLALSIIKANYAHNGIDYPNNEATGRCSNGKNAADFLAEKLGLPTSPPYLSLVKSSNNRRSFKAGVSFASAGAGIFDAADDLLQQSLPLTKQVDYYAQVCEKLRQQMGTQAANDHLSRSLHVVFIGTNDLADYLYSPIQKMQYTPKQYVNLMVSTLRKHLQRIHRLGARKFVVIGTEVMGCYPMRRNDITGECNEESNSVSAKYGAGLKSMMKQLKSELGISYTYFNNYSLLRKIIKNPSAYGFRNTKEACCGNQKFPCLPVSSYCSNRNDYMFWDFCHSTEATHRTLVNHLFDGSTYTFPMNVKKLASL